MTLPGWSHPTRVRGLKPLEERMYPDMKVSHPTRVRGLKQLPIVVFQCLLSSHPTRVRGLKLAVRVGV